MGNVLKKEKDPLEDAKRKAAKRRATKLKQKRRSTMHTREWDPSGDIGDGPTIGIGGQLGATAGDADEVGGSSQADSGWKVSRDKRASLKPTKEWDPSGDTDQIEERYKSTAMDPGESWKAALDLADVGAKEKLRRRSKRPSMRASMTQAHRKSQSLALSTLDEAIVADGVDAGGGAGAPKSRPHHRSSASAPVLPPPSTAPPATGSYTNTARLSLVKMKRASATNAGAGAGARAGAGAAGGASADAASSGTVRGALTVVAEGESERSSGGGGGAGSGAGGAGGADGNAAMV